MVTRTWKEELDFEFDMPMDFNERLLRATIEGNEEEFLKQYEPFFIQSTSGRYDQKQSILSKIPSKFYNNALRLIVEFKIAHPLKLVLWNYYGKMKGSYDSGHAFIANGDLKEIQCT